MDLDVSAAASRNKVFLVPSAVDISRGPDMLQVYGCSSKFSLFVADFGRHNFTALIQCSLYWNTESALFLKSKNVKCVSSKNYVEF